MKGEVSQCDEDIEWQCTDRRGCIDKRRRCDGYDDCADGSDENKDLCYNCKLKKMIDTILIYNSIYYKLKHDLVTSQKYIFNSLQLNVLIGNSNVLTEYDVSTNEGFVMATRIVRTTLMNLNAKRVYYEQMQSTCSVL